MPRYPQTRVKPDTGRIYYRTGIGTFSDVGGPLDKGFNLEGEPISYGVGGNPYTNFPGNIATTSGLIGTAVLGAPFAYGQMSNGSGPPEPVSSATIPGPPVVIAVASSAATRSIVGHPIMIYSIPQIIYVTYPASTAFGGLFMDNYPVNRTNFRMVRGIQNEVNFYVRDCDRKPVALGMSESLTIVITDPATDVLLMSRNLTVIDSTQGIYLLTVLPNEMDLWPTAPVRWSLSYNRVDGTTVLMWTDRNYSPYSELYVTKGPVPGPSPTIVVLWSDFVLMGDDNIYSPALIGAGYYGFTNGVQSFYMQQTTFTGSIRIDASLVLAPVDNDVSTDWFEVDLQTYTANTGYVLLNETGTYLWMRVVVLDGYTGTINQIEYKR